MKRTTLILLGVLVLAAIGGAFLFIQKQDVSKMSSTNLNQDAQTPGTSQENVKENNQNPILQPSSEYSVRPDFSKVKDFKKTLSLQRGVSVKYGDGWMGKKMENSDNVVSGQLVKTVNGRSYEISFGEIEYALPAGSIDNISLELYDETLINNKSHAIVVSSHSYSGEESDFAYISSCSAKEGKACPIPFQKTNLLIMLRQNIVGAQEPKGLDFTRQDDQQILAEFTEIASTLQY